VGTVIARTKNRGADLLAALLRAQGVQHVMALTGGAIMEGLDALQAADFLDVRVFQTEAGAAWAAVGYARATGRVGVCVVTSGPGATNTITALADAQRDNVPIVVITGQVAAAARNTDAFQETNIVAIAAPIAKKVFSLDRVEDMAAVIDGAFRTAVQGRPGPVLVDLTKDVQQACVPAAAFAPPEARPTAAPSNPRPSEAVIDEVITHLRRAERPVLLVGYGVVLAGAHAELARLLRLVPCPTVHTLPGKAAVPSGHPQNYGMVGMHGFYVSNWIIHHADLVMSLGARYDDRITGDPRRFAPAAKRLIHFDIDPAQIAKVLPERKLGVVGDLRWALAELTRRLEGTRFDFAGWRDAVAETAAQHPSTFASRPDVLQAQHVLEVLNDVVEQQVAGTGRRVIFTTEVGNHQMWAGQHVAVQAGWQFLTSSGQGAMGSGLPMAIGAQVADPSALVICLAGDGSLRFSEAELETLWEYGLPVKTLVFNNDGYGIVRMWNHRFYGGRETGVVKRHKDWVLMARGSGFDATRVDRVTGREGLSAVLRRALAHRQPHLVELVTPYEECLPLIPPGESFDEIIV
jgi:acetolactate synthase-1/2/3 large subunit